MVATNNPESGQTWQIKQSFLRVVPCTVSTQPTPAVDTITANQVTKPSLTSVTSHSGVTPKSSKKVSSKLAKTSSKKKTSPEFFPSDWDSSNKVESKSDKS
ncbi:hypothetical protein PGT21_009288 [Puccinia graminis f. sp. tritici]|uniref:Uncharacterized protein n=1 Tax=Puccinia graminis f. sp. tritici TaxID=56615 RepID=A0A5B0NXW8_PUCGR|nr:hypothetical protein PGT21_009288 [Puccinia graminis f. sp. tritici]